MAGNDDGHVREELGALREAVDSLIRTWSEQDRKATDGRREVYHKLEELRNEGNRKFEELKDEVRETSSEVKTLARDFLEMKPIVRGFEIARHRSAGARWVLRGLWGALATGVAAIAYVLHDWAGVIMGLLWPPKH